jgi:hypothetical protein
MRWAFVLAGALALYLSACSDTHSIEVDRAHCEQLRDHMIDLRITSATAGVDVKAHRAAMKEALGERFVESCELLSPSELECSLRARDLASASACSKSQ